MNLPSSSLLIKKSGLCLVMFLISQNALAFDLNIDNLNTNKTNTKPTNNNLIVKLPSLLVVEEINTAYLINEIKDTYLTFYSNKNENVEAIYVSGAYLLRYTNNW